MTRKPVVTVGQIAATSDATELQALVSRLRELVEIVDKAAAVEKAANDRAKLKRIAKTEEPLAEMTVVKQRLTTLLIVRYRKFWATLGKVIPLDNGVVRYRIDAKSLDAPRNTTVVVKFLLHMRGGKRYLDFKPSLNRDALTHANPTLLRKLARFGVSVRRHQNVTVKLEGQAEPITLSRTRYPKR